MHAAHCVFERLARLWSSLKGWRLKAVSVFWSFQSPRELYVSTVRQMRLHSSSTLRSVQETGVFLVFCGIISLGDEFVSEFMREMRHWYSNSFLYVSVMSLCSFEQDSSIIIYISSLLQFVIKVWVYLSGTWGFVVFWRLKAESSCCVVELCFIWVRICGLSKTCI